MRHRTPHFGPYAGVLCVVAPDGTLTPVPDLDTRATPPPVAIPEVFGSDPDPNKTKRGIDRTAKALYDEYQRAGSTLTYADAQNRVQKARNRLDR